MTPEQARKKAREIIGLSYREMTERLIAALLAAREEALEEAAELVMEYPEGAERSVTQRPDEAVAIAKRAIDATIRALQTRKP